MAHLKNKRTLGIAIGIAVYAGIFLWTRDRPADQGGDGQNDGAKSLVAVRFAIDALPHALGRKTKDVDCRVRGPLPDPDCTPGAVFEKATADTVCADGYSKTVRNVSVSLKKKIYRSYGIPYPQPFGSYELDHLIPLSIGGSNDAANLFPEAAAPNSGFSQKDAVENYLHQEVCDGHIDIKAAQAAIASDWYSIYARLSPEDIRALEAQFQNWADKGLSPRMRTAKGSE